MQRRGDEVTPNAPPRLRDRLKIADTSLFLSGGFSLCQARLALRARDSRADRTGAGGGRR
jgi:hypothetical protein